MTEEPKPFVLDVTKAFAFEITQGEWGVTGTYLEGGPAEFVFYRAGVVQLSVQYPPNVVWKTTVSLLNIMESFAAALARAARRHP